MPDHCPLPQRGGELLAKGQLTGNHCLVLPDERKRRKSEKGFTLRVKTSWKTPFFNKYINGNSRGVDFHTIHSHMMSRPLSCSQHTHPCSPSIFNAKCFKILSLLLFPADPSQNQDKETEIKFGRIPTSNSNSYLKTKVEKKCFIKFLPSQPLFCSHLTSTGPARGIQGGVISSSVFQDRKESTLLLGLGCEQESVTTCRSAQRSWTDPPHY